MNYLNIYNMNNINNPKDLKELYRLMDNKNEFNEVMKNINKNVYFEDEFNIQLKKTNFSDFSQNQNNVSSQGFKRSGIISKYQNERKNLLKAYIEYNDKLTDKINLELLRKNNLIDDEVGNEKPRQLINEIDNHSKTNFDIKMQNLNLKNLNNSLDMVLDNVSSRSVSIDKKSTKKIGDLETNTKSLDKSTINDKSSKNINHITPKTQINKEFYSKIRDKSPSNISTFNKIKSEQIKNIEVYKNIEDIENTDEKFSLKVNKAHLIHNHHLIEKNQDNKFNKKISENVNKYKLPSKDLYRKYNDLNANSKFYFSSKTDQISRDLDYNDYRNLNPIENQWKQRSNINILYK